MVTEPRGGAHLSLLSTDCGLTCGMGKTNQALALLKESVQSLFEVCGCGTVWGCFEWLLQLEDQAQQWTEQGMLGQVLTEPPDPFLPLPVQAQTIQGAIKGLRKQIKDLELKMKKQGVKIPPGLLERPAPIAAPAPEPSPEEKMKQVEAEQIKVGVGCCSVSWLSERQLLGLLETKIKELEAQKSRTLASGLLSQALPSSQPS